MLTEVIANGESKMEDVIGATKKAFSAIRTGRANPALLNRITVQYYGTPTPLTQMANISSPEPRLLLIQPWDKNVIKDIEKAINTSDLGLVPNNDGAVIRLAIPQLTEERRKDLVRLVKKETEEYRVGIRNVRRDLNEIIKKNEKDGVVSEDESRRLQDEVQKLTDKYIKEIDKLAENKEKEIMEV